MTVAIGQTNIPTRFTVLRSPFVVLVLVLAILPLLLMAPLHTPIGPMYWDLFIYFDAAGRIFHGQVPVVDFFVPVGPLGYYLFAGGLTVFPNAQPLLLVDWSLLAVTAPLMALVMAGMERPARGTAFALLVPFLVFALLPFNTREFYPFPGTDGFGIYNRQVCQVLYVLVAGLVFVRNQRLLGIIVTAAVTALFFLKITGFLAALLICVFALLAGRVTLRCAIWSAATFFAVLLGLELLDGMISQYATDILSLVDKNSDTMLPRIARAASQTFGIAAPSAALALLLLWTRRDGLAAGWRALAARPSFAALHALIDRDAFWIVAVVTAGVFFESQNTGSQALIFLWPVLLALLAAHLPGLREFAGTTMAVAVLVGAAALPPFVNVLERAARTYVGAIKDVPLESENLKTLGRVLVRPKIMARAAKMMDFYPRHRDAYADFVRIGELPSYIFYSEFDFQVEHLMAIDRVVADIRALEAARGIRFNSIMELNFVDPIPYLLGREAPKYIAIGADPSRAVPQPGSEEEKAVRNTDLVLYPTCPPTTANQDLYNLYAPALKDHRRITLDACFDAFVSPRLAGKL